MVRDFLDALAGKQAPPIDAVRAMDYTVPGIIAHQAAQRGGVWLDVPYFGMERAHAGQGSTASSTSTTSLG